MMCKVLIFGCIAAVVLMTFGTPCLTKPLCTQEDEALLLKASMEDLKQLKNSASLEDSVLLYTPNDKQECNQTSLECYLKELEVVKQDVEEEDRRHIINIQKNLDRFKAGNSLDLTCKTCESHNKKNFSEFRQELNRFLQHMLKNLP